MCTALTLNTNDFYFGRTLDLDCSYGEEVVVMPRAFTLHFRKVPAIGRHFAIIGMATVVADTPLFYDASNEFGLSMAGLNFPTNAKYYREVSGKDNITPFEFIPWILCQCKTVEEAKVLLSGINLVDIPFSDSLPLSPLHWIVADKTQSIVVEAMSDGMHIYQNPVGVMTNNPPFEYHLQNLCNYRGLSITNGENTFCKGVQLDEYCQGLGGIGLPGDVSSMSRFVRIAFARANSVCNADEKSSVSQFFHLLSYVEMPRGICLTPNGHYDITVYTSCINADRGVYYYTTYDNRQINCVDMHKTDLEGCQISRYSLITEQQLGYQN